MGQFVRAFSELRPEENALTGGKGAALARLAQSGYPVPDGFIILTTAFAGDDLVAEAWVDVLAAANRLRGGDPELTLAVRSSADQEDGALASFAGGFETVLDVRGDGALREAIATVRRSGNTERVRAYAEAQQCQPANVAVVVQRQVAPDYAGVLFTIDPVTGDRQRMVGNCVQGIGERLVAGEANAREFTVDRGVYHGPSSLRPAILRLSRLAAGMAASAGCPQDIEWALVGRKVFILQSRPITAVSGNNPATGEVNDSLTGDWLWSSANLREAIPSVMTPSTWSIIGRLQTVTSFPMPDGRELIGNIAGRPYVNLSLLASLSTTDGKDPVAGLHQSYGLFGAVPEGMRMPMVPITRRELIALAPKYLAWQARLTGKRRSLSRFVADAPALCARLAGQISGASSPVELAGLLQDIAWPLLVDAYLTLRSVTARFDPGHDLQRDLARAVGASEAEALLNASTGGEALASLGPLLGLARLAKGELTAEQYLQQFGHRCPDEYELSVPRPVEQPSWLERQMASNGAEAAITAEVQFHRRQAEQVSSLERLNRGHSREARTLRSRIDRVTHETREREAVRSEVVRFIGVMRAGYLRAGELMGIGPGVFFLTLPELVAVLGGNGAALSCIPARKATDSLYRSLPPYPALIRGRFDPVAWAADPLRRQDVFDTTASSTTASVASVLRGVPAGTGRCEGSVRVLQSPEEIGTLCQGEVLVTSTTNIGWTLAFPRCGAIVTDIGAALSHAAIVARELGVPAVLGCGDATVRLKTGDRVIVDGGSGTIEIVARRDA